MSRELTRKQRAFVEAYLTTWNATEAARQIGYKHPNMAGPRLILRDDIKRTVSERMLFITEQTKQRLIGGEVFKVRKLSCIVYLIHSANGLVKIGKASDIKHRFATLNISSPVDLELIGVKETDDAGSLEDELHCLYADKRVKGEWFLLTDEDLRFLKDKYGFD